MIPIFDRHLDITHSCGDGEVTFTIVNGEARTAAPVTVKRSDGTEHGVAELPPGGVLVETIDGDQAWVSVWAAFPTRVWHARVAASCAAAPTSSSTTAISQPTSSTTAARPGPWGPPHHPLPSWVPRPVPATVGTTVGTSVAATTPPLPYTGAGTEVTAGVGFALVAAGVVLLLARKRGSR